MCRSVFPKGMDSVRRTYTIMRGRHIDKRVPSKDFLSALDKAETAGFFYPPLMILIRLFFIYSVTLYCLFLLSDLSL